MKTHVTLLAFVCLNALNAGAGLERYAALPGYIDLGDLRQFEDGESVTEVIIPNTLIRMAAAMARKDEPQFADMLKHLDLVHVHAIEVKEGKVNAVADHITALSKRLDQAGWDILVRMREGDEQNHIYILPEGEEGVHGLCVLALDGNEAVFVNIVGHIDLDMLSRLGAQFDIPGLDKVTEASAPPPAEPAP